MPIDPSPFTRWVVAHPVLWALTSGLTIFGLALSLFDGEYWAVWLAVSAGFGLLTYGLWSRWGPGRRLRAHMLRRFPKAEGR